MTHKVPTRQRWLAEFALLSTAVIWGINIPVVKSAIGDVDALTFNALRMVLSTITLWGLSAAEKRMSGKSQGELPVMRWVWFVLLSGVIYPFLFMFGIDRTTAGNVALLLATMPVWTALLSFVFVGERLARVVWIGLMISLVGTGCVIFAGQAIDLSSEYFVGNLLVLSAACAWASATVSSGPILSRVTALRLAFLTSLASTPIQLLVTVQHIPSVVEQLSQPSLLIALFYSGVMSTGVAYATWHYGVGQLGGSHAAVFQNLVVLVAVLAAWMFLGEELRIEQVIGGLILFGGLFLIRRSRSASSRNSGLDEKRSAAQNLSAKTAAVSEPMDVELETSADDANEIPTAR